MNKLCFPRLCGLLAANPSGLSQAMHNAGFKALGLDYSYTAFATVDTELGLKACRELGFRGLSLTIPHKEAAMSLVDTLSVEAKEIGSINTVINDGEHLHGHNTDYFGIIEAIKEQNFSAQKALLIGAGGASRGAIYALRKLGIREVKICNRTAERAKKLAQEFSSNDFSLEQIDLSTIEQTIKNNSMLILNSTPANDIFNLDILNSGHIVFDMVTAETELIKTARIKGATTIAGIRMLLHQALMQFELFTELKAPKEAMEKALLATYSLSK